MHEAPSLVSIFGPHLRHRGFEPFLFVQEGWDWRWLSFEAVAAGVAEAAHGLQGVPAGTAVGYLDRLRVEDVLLDLALQLVGLVAVPAADAETARARGAEAWIERGDGAGPLTPIGWTTSRPSWSAYEKSIAVADSGPSWSSALPGPEKSVTVADSGPSWSSALPGPEKSVTGTDSGPSWSSALPWEGERLSGGARVARGGVVETWSSPTWTRAGVDAARELGPITARGLDRDITVLAGTLADPLRRAQLGWALAAGAAVLLEGEPASWLDTAVWARPTVLAGSAEDLAALGARGEAVATGRRSPLGRFRAWWVEDLAAVPAEQVERWHRRGVRVLGMPRCDFAVAAI